MKKHYDFSKAERGKLHRPIDSLQIPVYLDRDVLERLQAVSADKQGLSDIVNRLLRSQIEAAHLLEQK